jgi:hypothetical protein
MLMDLLIKGEIINCKDLGSNAIALQKKIRSDKKMFFI